nr:vegetative cell wall protein gp1-like [Ovis aries]
MEGCGRPCLPPAPPGPGCSSTVPQVPAWRAAGGPACPLLPQDLGVHVPSPRCRHGGLRVALLALCSPGPGCACAIPQVPAWRAVGGPACPLLPRTWVLKYCPPGAGMEGCGWPCSPSAPQDLGVHAPSPRCRHGGLRAALLAPCSPGPPGPGTPALSPCAAPCSLARPPFLLLMAMLCRFLQVENRL